MLVNWLKNAYNKVITSIAFLPAVIALALFGCAYLMIWFDFSGTGKHIKANLNWLSLKDASTARSICTAIASGVISLTVFSFSMVMILLSQAASQMSNRVLGKLITNTFQQVVLGFYIGTIIYALFLLSTIRDIDTGIHVPAISTYLLIALTIVDIFLFIYFLHYITNSVKFETIIYNIFSETSAALKRSCKMTDIPIVAKMPPGGVNINAPKSGLYQGFQQAGLLKLCRDEDVVIAFLYPIGTYLLEQTPLLVLYHKKPISDNFEEKLSMLIDVGKGNDIKTSFYHGFRQLMEIAIKGLSPGINDPGTATIALQALADLMAYRSAHFPEPCLLDEDNLMRVVTREKTFEELFQDYILPIWDYGKNDRLIQHEMLHILTLLQMRGERRETTKLLHQVWSASERES